MVSARGMVPKDFNNCKTAAAPRGLCGRHGGGSTNVCNRRAAKLLPRHVVGVTSMAWMEGAGSVDAPPPQERGLSSAAHTAAGRIRN